MTDRYNALIVALDRDIREDDAEFIINAIRMIKGVSGVTGNVTDADTFSATIKVTSLVSEKLYQLIKELNSL